jgi:hypothetical protein
MENEDRMRLYFTALAFIAAAIAVGEGAAFAADPTTADCLAASDASLKLGNDHKLRAERSQLLVCAAPTCPADIRKECLGRVDEVNAQVPTIVFSAKDSSGADLSAVRVTMDGEVLAERFQGTALSIDPGEHTFTFETAGQPPVMKKLVIVQGQKDRREVITFGTDQGGTATPAALPSTPPPNDSGGMGTQKILAIVAGGIGIVGLGLGTVFGIMASSQKNDAQSACPSNPCATQDGVNKWSTAGSTGNISTIGFIVGGVGVAGAAVLWFTAPSSSNTQVGFGPGILQLKGTW